MERHRYPGRRRREPQWPWRLGWAVAGALVATVVVVVVGPFDGRSRSDGADAAQPPSTTATAASSSAPSRSSHAAVADAPDSAPWAVPLQSGARGHLRTGSQPSVLPASLLIADKLNNRLVVVDPQGRLRWIFPRKGDLAPGQTFKIPDDAFFSPDGKYIIATQEDDSVISLIDVAKHRIVYRYGVSGQPGMSANHLSNPDDAMVMPNGNIITADIKNCRLLVIARNTHVPLHVFGTSTNACRHDPPAHWGSPNGVFPMPNGHYLVTEINGDWVDEFGLNGKVYWSVHPPDVAYPSDSSQIGADRYLTVDYSSNGQVVIFNREGNTLWRWDGSNTGVPGDQLDHPSLALALPNGDIVLNDDYKHRVLVVDPRTNKIVWQYGVTGVPGSGAGYLNNPDGLDLVPPHSFLGTQASTMGNYPP